MQWFHLGGQGIGGSHSDGFARISLSVQNHKAILTKESAYQFNWYFNNKKYVGIKMTNPNGKIIYDQSWNGNQAVPGNYGQIEDYALPEGSIVEIYHAEGAHNIRFQTSDYNSLKQKSGHTYTYKMMNNRVVLTPVN